MGRVVGLFKVSKEGGILTGQSREIMRHPHGFAGGPDIRVTSKQVVIKMRKVENVMDQPMSRVDYYMSKIGSLGELDARYILALCPISSTSVCDRSTLCCTLGNREPPRP